MADYRFSAQAISRSKGQSSVASAAYRAGARLIDERTGEIHDYGRKAGVVHSEVMAPQATPDWMHDRAQLWNAVEAVERRKDAQLAREIQLSLPHELNAEQRKQLVRGFVQEQFVSHGMIADIAIHAPSEKGDQRNHHAHVMLTMRELSGDGFGKKNRDWNSPEMLGQWRENWALHQNRALERHGHESRVDHRSYEAQGIDREPTQHLGPVASDMERNGKASRIGDENRTIANDNAARVQNHIEAARLASEIAREKWKFGQWTEFKRHEIEAVQKLADIGLSQKHNRQRQNLERQLEQENGTAKLTIKAEVDSIDRRLQAQGVRKVVRDIFGRTKSDKATRDGLYATLKGIETRENERRQALFVRQEAERGKEANRQQKNRDRLEKGIQTARERREATGWKPRHQSSQKAPSPTPEQTRGNFTASSKPERAKDFDEPTLADKTNKPANRQKDEKSTSLNRPWNRASTENERDNDRPWNRDALSRERAPLPSPDGSGGKGGKD